MAGPAHEEDQSTGPVFISPACGEEPLPQQRTQQKTGSATVNNFHENVAARRILAGYLAAGLRFCLAAGSRWFSGARRKVQGPT